MILRLDVRQHSDFFRSDQIKRQDLTDNISICRLVVFYYKYKFTKILKENVNGLPRFTH